MNKVKIFTDSTVDLSKELVEKYEIGVVPLYVNIEDSSYLDGVEITTADLYKLVGEKQTLPKTSTAPVTDFVNAFAPWINAGYDIIFIGVSSKLSSTYQTAALAGREFDEGRVTLVDSLSLSTGTALQVIKAAELAKAGMDSKTIAETVSKITPRVRASFIIDTLKYLHMGGRCSAVQLLASNVLKIHP
ncbi:MAG TPA: DegV family protein, partial [Candidatus Atribacteria bacterium]|nr:DegV family protein [Candidatus Atribacteria bacterium]